MNNNDIKNSNRDRFIYSLFFLFVLVLLSIIYASLAVNVGVKINTPKIIEPVNDKKEIIPETNPVTEEVTPYYPVKRNKPSKNVTPTPTPTPKPTPEPEPDIPVIDPTDDDWLIEFENVKVYTGSVNAIKSATIAATKTEVDYEVKLSQPGDYYKFDVEIKNKGNLDAKIYNILESGLSTNQKKYLLHQVTYSNGNTIKANDELLSGETKKITVLLKFRDDINSSDLPNQKQDISISYKITYIQK